MRALIDGDVVLRYHKALVFIIGLAPDKEPEGYGDTSHYRWDGYTKELGVGTPRSVRHVV